MPLERYAAVGACLRFFPRSRKGEILDRLGIELNAWEAARAAWSAAIEEDTKACGSLLADWSQAFDGFGQRLRELSPTVEALDLSQLVPAPPPPSEPDSEKPRELPSYLMAASKHAEPEPLAEARFAQASPLTGELSTAEMHAVDLSAVPPLPFVERPVARPPVARPPLSPRMSGTLDLATPKRPRPPTMPFRTPGAPSAAEPKPSLPKLTFNQYAALKAELSAFPENADRIWSKYGVDSLPARDVVEQHWLAVLGGDPAKQQHFTAVYNQYYRQWAPKSR